MDIKQICSLCSLEFTLYKVFMEHIENNHSSEFNCQECDFQAGSSRIVLAKHLNLRHRKIEEQTNDTLKWNQCEQQFSAQWNLKNHIRDNHEKLTIVNILNKEVVVFHKMSAGIGTNTLFLQVKEQICRREKNAMFAKQNSKGSMIWCYIGRKPSRKGQALQGQWKLPVSKLLVFAPREKCEEQETKHSKNGNEPEEVQSENKSESVQSKVTPQDFQNVNTNPKAN